MLWIQSLREEERARFEKVDGSGNPADLMTKDVGGKLLEEHCGRIGLHPEEGRASKAAQVSRGITV